MKGLVEVHSPFTNRLSIIVRVEEPSGNVLFAPLDDLPLNLGRGPAIETFVSGLPGICMLGSTHAVNCPIASNTD